MDIALRAQDPAGPHRAGQAGAWKERACTDQPSPPWTAMPPVPSMETSSPLRRSWIISSQVPVRLFVLLVQLVRDAIAHLRVAQGADHDPVHDAAVRKLDHLN